MLADEMATIRLAEAVASRLRRGDIIALQGDLGAGKTTFARAALRYLAGDPGLEVPSPTFTLVQPYAIGSFLIAHADYYRLGDPDEARELAIDETLIEGAALIEWPEKGVLPKGAVLTVSLSRDPAGTHHARMIAGPGWKGRAARLSKLLAFLDRAGFATASWRHIQGDASTRSYQRLSATGNTAILIDSPEIPDGPAVKDGLPYSRIAHLAENIRPFIAMAGFLTDNGFSAPSVIDADTENGFALLEDLGDEGVTEGVPPRPIMPRYKEAVRCLAALHAIAPPKELETQKGQWRLNAYDREILQVETGLLADWFVPFAQKEALPTEARAAFEAAWGAAIEGMPTGPDVLVLRDFHSPNLLWLEHRQGIRRIGLLDFQDALIGSAAYDLASLTQDARVDVSADEEEVLLQTYGGAVGLDGKTHGILRHAHAVMGGQRSTKVLGIFVRLSKRDGKHGYLKHLPRLVDYLARNLSHPGLEPVRHWHERHLPLEVMRAAAQRANE